MNNEQPNISKMNETQSIKNDTVFLHKAEPSSFVVTDTDLKEVFRYAGIINQAVLDEDEKQKLTTLATEAIAQIQAAMNCRAVYLKTDLTIIEQNTAQKPTIIFANKKIESADLAKNLKNCNAIFLFAATLGQEVDKAILRATKLEPAKAVFLQAAGAMFIEKYCDQLEDFLLQQENKENLQFCPRFSPGYGDLSLEVQNHFFALLQCEKKLSLTLNDCLLMLPEKSVTAFIGIKHKQNKEEK